MIEINPSASDWNALLAGLPQAHLLQTREWGEVKQKYGWAPVTVVWKDGMGVISAAALILEKGINIGGFSAGFSILYTPRGPVLDWSNRSLRSEVLFDLRNLAIKRRAIFIKIDPEILLGTGIPGTEDAEDFAHGRTISEELSANGWVFSQDQIQFRNTAELDLNGSDDDWLARMHQKTRYNLRLAQKKGVIVRHGCTEDLPLLYRMYAETSLRDGFVIRDSKYYQTLWRTFMDKGLAEPLIAEVEGKPVAGLILFHFGKRAWYLYGMSRDLHREKMPNYLLQWEAMKTARERGCTTYDLWGAPDTFDEKDSMYGVFRFKDGLGAKVIRSVGAWDFTSRPILYRLYTDILPRILNVMRRRGKKATRRQVGL
jgi:lipid II:glycine glycyltransferase (peptidoglycan interpeptide bridge formation enzyme)